ncbi:hypothetical protein [Microbacter margulisiae]|uniref:Uncharacterized protein n=1 Tax=Microbacter margulisiae TaxID=1350067 RepID=A0A7W5DQN9_9PORP|nr:hypothetical protein [Microbacter margulisiae]MBB3187302.1 hypothetical protein [Microbacter margulisiae]
MKWSIQTILIHVFAWTLTGNSYLPSFSDSDASYSNIVAGSYHLYVNNVLLK